jgi:hypothetical protein
MFGQTAVNAEHAWLERYWVVADKFLMHAQANHGKYCAAGDPRRGGVAAFSDVDRFFFASMNV